MTVAEPLSQLEIFASRIERSSSHGAQIPENHGCCRYGLPESEC